MNQDLEQKCEDTINVMNLISSINKENLESLLSERVVFFSYLREYIKKDRKYDSSDEEELRALFNKNLLNSEDCFHLSSSVQGIDFSTFNFHKEVSHLLVPKFKMEWINDELTPIEQYEVTLLFFLEMIPYEY